MTVEAPATSQQTRRTPARLRRRADFLRATKAGARLSRPAFSLQMAARSEDVEGAPRFGFTVTKKVAGAVGRNRIRRRLREALRLGAAEGAHSGMDYVFVARRAALTTPFQDILQQMAEGVKWLDPTRSTPARRNTKTGPKAP